MNKPTPTTIAWVTDEDIRSERTADGGEQLLVDGRVIPLTDADIHASQQVINYCMCNKRSRRALRAFWASKVEQARWDTLAAWRAADPATRGPNPFAVEG